MDFRDERRALQRGAHIVVGTPGRLRDHIERNSLDTSAFKAIVLDEADEMLDLGFREDLEFILGSAPAERRTLMFSATVPRTIASLAKRYQRDAVRVSTSAEREQHIDIEYRALSVTPTDREIAIINVLRFYEAKNALVFCSTRAAVNRMTSRFTNRGFSVVALSGELSQNERTHALQAMRDGRARVCIATDVAARGIDLPNLELVIHAEMPNNQDTLLHRSGRTGRAGRKGVSAMIVAPSVRKKAERLLGWAKLTAEWGNAPTADEVSAKDQERMLENPDWNAPIADSDQGTVNTLVENFSAEQIAARTCACTANATPPQKSCPISPTLTNHARHSGPVFGSLWKVVVKRAPNRARMLPMLCKMGDLSKEDLGAIRIQQTESFIEIRKSAVKRFLDAIGPDMTVEDNAKLTQLDKAPKLDRAPRAANQITRIANHAVIKRPTKNGKNHQRAANQNQLAQSIGTTIQNRVTRSQRAGTNQMPRRKTGNLLTDHSGAVVSKPGKSTKPDGPRGPKPPKGKASSKKNRARQWAAKQEGKGCTSHQG